MSPEWGKLPRCRRAASPPPLPRSAAVFLALMPRAARLTDVVRSAENLKDGDRAFHSVEGSKIVTMIYYDQLIQRAARISQLLNISLTKYVIRKYSIVTKVHKSATCIFTYEIIVSIYVFNTLNDSMST